MTHVFDAATALTSAGDGVFFGRTHPAYNNMVGPYGGIVAATVVKAISSHPEVLAEPLALTVNFTAPVAEGEFEIATTIVRTNRTNQHWTFMLLQNSTPVVTGTAVYGVRRDTWEATEAAPPSAPAPQEIERSAFPDFIAWAGNYDMRFAIGGLDSGKSDNSTSTLWLQDAPPRPLDFPSLTSMSDAFFPRVFLRHGTYMPAGTISLTTYFHASAADLAAQGDRPVLGTASAARFGNGHFDQYGQLWGDGGVLLATTHQLVYFKNP